MADFKLIKEHVSLPDVLARYGIELRGVNGKTRTGNCPLPQHTSEDRSGFKVTLGDKGWGWSCHSQSCIAARNTKNTRKGGLKKGGDLIEFVQFMEQLSSLKQAGEVLESWFGPFGGDGVQAAAPKVAPVQVVEAPAGMKPLGFELAGLNPRHAYLKLRGFEEEECEYLGVGFFPGKGMMSGRVVFPIHDAEGNLVAYAGRSVDDTEPRWKLPLGFHKGQVLYNLHRVCGDSVVVVESFWGVLACVRAGIFHAVAIMGSQATDAQVITLVDKFVNITILLDGDEAGRAGTKNLLERLVNAGAENIETKMLRDGVQPPDLKPDTLRVCLGIPPEPDQPLMLTDEALSYLRAVPA